MQAYDDRLADYFKFRERNTNLATEARAGLTTFMVMAYIIFLNPGIIAKPLGLDPVAVSAGTALIAGIMTIAMGIVGQLSLRAGGRPRDQCDRRLHADRQGPDAGRARWA